MQSVGGVGEPVSDLLMTRPWYRSLRNTSYAREKLTGDDILYCFLPPLFDKIELLSRDALFKY